MKLWYLWWMCFLLIFKGKCWCWLGMNIAIVFLLHLVHHRKIVSIWSLYLDKTAWLFTPDQLYSVGSMLKYVLLIFESWSLYQPRCYGAFDFIHSDLQCTIGNIHCNWTVQHCSEHRIDIFHLLCFPSVIWEHCEIYVLLFLLLLNINHIFVDI